MSDTDTSFVRDVRRLKPPTSGDFDIAAWDQAYTRAAGKTSDDQRLLETARWISRQAEAARSFFEDPALAGLSPEWGTTLAVAALNREFRTAAELAAAKVREGADAGMLAADALAALRVENVMGQSLSMNDLVEVGVDCTENWLFDAARSTGREGAQISDLAPTAVRATQAYSFRKSLNNLWNEALHEGWRLCEGERPRWTPADPEHERLKQAWLARHEANLMNFANIDRTLWPNLPEARRKQLGRKRTVVEVKLSDGGEPRFKSGPVSYLSKRMPAYNYEKAMLESSPLAEFVDARMPADPRLSVSLLLLAWHVLYDAARRLAALAPLPVALSPREAERLALAVNRTTLTQALSDALRVENAVGAALIEFLMFKPKAGGAAEAKGNKGLWAAPLVQVPGSSRLLLALPVLATSNVARRAEAWLEEGGIDDSNPAGARGDRYEVVFRSKIDRALESNEIFRSALSASAGVPKSKRFTEQVDLIVALGGLCLVGELKFFLFPADPHERARYSEKLLDAAKQARRKCSALDTRRDVVAEALGTSVTHASGLRLLPIVVTNQGYGFSMRVDGVLIVEAGFLRTYLGSGEILSGKVLQPLTGASVDQHHTLYRSEAEAERVFEATVEKPWVLTRFLDRVKWKETPFPTPTGEILQIPGPVLGDVAGLERLRAESIIAHMGW